VLVSHHTILLDLENPYTMEFQRLMNHGMFLSNNIVLKDIHKTYMLWQYYSSYALLMMDLGEWIKQSVQMALKEDFNENVKEIESNFSGLGII